MAIDKFWREAFARLDRIEAKLDQLAGSPAGTQAVNPFSALPWDGYDEMTVEQIVERLPALDDGQRAHLLAFERAHKNRTGVITPLVNWNS